MTSDDRPIQPDTPRGPGRPQIGPRLNITIRPDQAARIRTIATDRDRPIAEVVRAMIDAFQPEAA